MTDSRRAPLPGIHHDAVVVGAGFAGMYAVHKLRDQLGLSVQAFERGSDVGGTWFWNCYPGARTDGEAMDYSYSFSEELQQEWTWTHRYATQPEILRYQNHVADRFDLRRTFCFETTVTAATWDEARHRWTVETDRGDVVTATYLVMASGVLSHAKTPDFPGIDSFEGEWYQSSAWPREGVDLAGKRVAIVGTGSTGIQLVPHIAEQCAHLTVFQRTANFSVPAQNRPLQPEHVERVKARYAEHRASARASGAGVTEIRDYDEPGYGLAPRPLETTAAMMSEEERRRQLDWRWGYGGLSEVLGVFGDIMVDEQSNQVVADYAREVIRRTVKDPETAERLCPTDHPFGSKRLCLDTDYYATFNRDNVELVSLRESPIEGFTPRGIRTIEREHDVDVVVFALGFDALTGALLDIDIRGVDGRPLRQAWRDGPRSYLGLNVHGFPNMFTIVGPLSPSVLSNMVNSIEQHVEWVADAIQWLGDHGYDRIEAESDAQDGWVAHVAEVAGSTLYTRANSWYIGANVPGKPRVFLPYLGGVGQYRAVCDEVAGDRYRGFALAGAARTPPHPQLAAFLASLAEVEAPPLYEMDVDEARDASAGFLALVGNGPAVAEVEELWAPGPDGGNPARLYVPEDPVPGLCVYVHGGGWVLGDLDWCDPVCRWIANGSRMRVLSIDYSLAPEHRFPAAIDDVTAAVAWAASELAEGGPLALAGDSAGGNLVAVAARRARDAGGPAIDLQVLIYPVVSPDFETGSYVANGDAGLPLGRREMEYFWDAYAPGPLRLDPDADPMQAASLAGLPPAVVLVAGYDPLHDEGLAYAARLAAEGTPTETVAFEDMNHGFFNLINFFERADEAVDLVAARLARLAQGAGPRADHSQSVADHPRDEVGTDATVQRA